MKRVPFQTLYDEFIGCLARLDFQMSGQCYVPDCLRKINGMACIRTG